MKDDETAKVIVLEAFMSDRFARNSKRNVGVFESEEDYDLPESPVKPPETTKPDTPYQVEESDEAYHHIRYL